jgi:DNA-binding MarR family transcriptional regulator
LQDEALQNHSVQSHHLGILKVLEVSGRQSQIHLGEEMGFDKASMVKIIDHLEQQKLVERQPHPTDRRIKNVMITAKGIKLIKSSREVREKVENLFFKDLTAPEQQIFRNLISRVIPHRKSCKKETG